ncbi:hypothetical protein THAOC_16469 [Thalassiosira oceanica]|uniref:Small ribosomal subunit protein mS29 n=1 Tax=Thalassiosira oceanica TaxID=159749 RepID=K0SPG3_THAOC|nr:hypothetical protein THAOC_16469 [Thalassiosira oceanica]|eukprot:EJK62901.1 hypothetical protein THAOC_16469 [Thalassiosira oceanica]
MLRLCVVQGARSRHRPGGTAGRWLSSLPGAAQTSADDDDGGRRAVAPVAPLAAASPHRLASRRRLGVSRHLDPLARPGPLNTLDEDDDVIPGDGGEESMDESVARKVQELSDDYWDDYGGGDDLAAGGDFDDIFGDSASGLDDGEEKSAAAEYNERQVALAAEFAQRKGRLWDDEWVIPDEEWLKNETWDDIEEWRPGNATRVSVESVRVFGGGVPTLGEMAGLDLPAPLPSHPGDGNPQRVRGAPPAGDVPASQARRAGDDPRRPEEDTRDEVVGGQAGRRGRDVRDDRGEGPGERADNGPAPGLRLYGRERAGGNFEDAPASEEGDDKDKEETKPEPAKVDDSVLDVMDSKREKPVPIFMDLLKIGGKSKSGKDDDADSDTNKGKAVLSEFLSGSNDKGVPNLIYPLNVHPNDGTGRMVEEWELAAKKDTKRIMMRSVMREVAEKIVEACNCCDGDAKDVEKGSARVLVTGKNGNGKTALLAGIVASARVSGHIVLYMPDGDRLRRRGYYVEPCPHREKLYVLPEIAKELCAELLTSHGDDLKSLTADRTVMGEFMSDELVGKLFDRAAEAGESVDEDASELSLDRILEIGKDSSSLSSGCHSTVISALMNQKEKPFTVVMDEFNCYYDHGHYFHGHYDADVRKAIPLDRITVFKPFLDAMGLRPTEAGTEMGTMSGPPDSEKRSAMMDWGSIVVATSESRAVRRSFTRSLSEAAAAASSGDDGDCPVHVVDVGRFDGTEVRHALYNFEITGIGRLRFDRGDTTLNPEEIEYLRLVSGGKVNSSWMLAYFLVCKIELGLYH